MIISKPIENESGQDFANRICRENAMTGTRWPKAYKCRFIEPGLVHYNEFGTVLVQKPALDKMAKSFIGKPVVNVVHKDVSPQDFNNGEADGIVTDVWYDPDGWYWANFLVWDPATQKNCESSAYSVSCAYDLKESKDEGGVHNNLAYSQEVVDGEYTHLAIVANPRYEGARILYNSKGGTDMKWKFWQTNGKDKVELQNISENSTVEIDGKEVSIKELVEVHNSVKPAATTKVSVDSVIDLDGKEMTVKELINSYQSVKNAEKDEKEKEERENAHKAGSHKPRMANCSLCNAEDEKDKKDADEKKNAEDKEKEDKEKRENSVKDDKHFIDLRNASQMRGGEVAPKIISKSERIAEGAKRYGTVAK